jgi:hypothetical protein
MPPLRLHDVPFEMVPHEAKLLVYSTPAGFPSLAQDDIEEPIDLAGWQIEHPAASYLMRVSGHSMTGAASWTATWSSSAGRLRRGSATSRWRRPAATWWAGPCVGH